VSCDDSGGPERGNLGRYFLEGGHRWDMVLEKGHQYRERDLDLAVVGEVDL
jgi:hypothetical protein